MKQWIVYRHVCKANGKSYIGITCQKPKARWGNGKGYTQKNQTAFANAIKKYGWEGFTHEILESNLTLDQANSKEQYWIAYYHTWIYDPDCNGYNITKGGDGTLGYKMSEKTKRHLSEIKKGKPGYKFSEEQKQRISILKKQCGNGHTNKIYINNGQECFCIKPEDLSQWESKGFKKGRLTSKEARLKWSKPVICVETNQVYASGREASYQLGLQESRINVCCHNPNKTTGGYHWQYKEENI